MSDSCICGTVESYDGGHIVMVRHAGRVDPLRFLRTYTPAPGDRVVVTAVDGVKVVLGRPSTEEAMNAHQC